MNFFDLLKLSSVDLTKLTFVLTIVILLIIVILKICLNKIKKSFTLNKFLIDRVNKHKRKEYEKKGKNTEPILEPEERICNHIEIFIKLSIQWLYLVSLLWVLFSSFTSNIAVEYRIAIITIILPLLLKFSKTVFDNLKPLLDTLIYLTKLL